MLSLCAPAQPFTNSVTFLENQKPGSTSWLITNPTPTSGGIEGYASATSVTRGEQIKFLVNTTNSAYILQVYRIGWYGGAGARQVFGPMLVPGTVQPLPAIQPGTLLLECNWTNPFTLTVTNNPDDPTDWASGVYLAKLSGSDDGYQSYIIFAVRDDARASDLLAQMSFSTYEAYNTWGGTSLYGSPTLPTYATKVSFNRPFSSWARKWFGSGHFFASQDGGQAAWECNLVRWLEREGYDVSYCTSLDVHTRTNLLLNHKAFISMGHDEYWSFPMRMNVQGARDRGVNLAFLSSGTSLWQVRFEPSTVDGTPNRTMVCYRSVADPVASTSSNYLTTVMWRSPPASLPEHLMIGVGYDSWGLDADLVVSDPNHWIFANTGAQLGQRLVGLLGTEIDVTNTFSPSGIRIACTSPYTDPFPPPVRHPVLYSEAASYQTAAGSTVFAGGSMQWSWGLDDFNVPALRSSRQSPILQQTTRNVLARMLSSPPPSPTFLFHTDTNTRGGWLPHYGCEGYVLPGDSTNLPPFATLSDGGAPVALYLPTSMDTNALQSSLSTNRFLGGWFSSTNFTIDLNLSDGQNHQVALYFWDWDNSGHQQTVDVVDVATTNLVDHRVLSGFTNGEWWVYQVNGHVQFRIAALTGPDCVLNGLMLGSGSQARFVCEDPLTQGNWQAAYGADAAYIAGHLPSTCAYASLSAGNGPVTNWSLGTLDPRAPIQCVGSNCVFAAWTASGYFANDLNLNVTDNQWHQLAVYCVDPDGLGRKQVVSLVDPGTHLVLDSRTVGNFSGGKYLVWNFRGPVNVRLQSLNLSSAVVSGIFLGPPRQPPSVSLIGPAGGQPFELPTNIVITAAAHDPTGSVAQVSFYANSNYLGTATNLPFLVTWTNPPLGAYALTAVAIDNFNASATSAPVNISVTAGPSCKPPTVQVAFPPDGALMASPTNMVLSATATPGSGPLVGVQFIVDGIAVGPVLNSEPFTLSAGNWLFGTHSLCASVTDTFGIGTFSATNVVTVIPPQASAVFRHFDFAPGGNWQGVYGSQGYVLAHLSTQLPPYASIQPTVDAWLPWASVTSERRALRLPNSSQRLAGAWYAFGNLLLDVNLRDGQPHRIALYCLDWDGWGSSQTISVLDAATTQVLDTETLVGFTNGAYAVWDVAGHVQFSVTPSPLVRPAVVSAVFIDPPFATPVVNLLAPTNAARFGQHDNIPFTALASSGTAPLSRVEFLVNGAVLGADSSGPPYTSTWTNAAPGAYVMAARAVDVLGSNALSAPVAVNVERMAAACLLTLDTKQQGDWRGVYGQQGYFIAGDSTNPPSYGTVSVACQQLVWTTNTSNVLALQSSTGSNRVAAAWYSFTNLLLDVSFTDGAFHHVGLYFLDWLGSGVRQTVEVLDNRSGVVLDHRQVTFFSSGCYYIYDIAGHVTIRISGLNGSPAVLSGIFFDASQRLPAVTLTVPADGSTFYVPEEIPMIADAAPDPAVTQMDFLQGGTLIGSTSEGPPYMFTWTNPPPGIYSLSARVVSPVGATNSLPVGVSVVLRSNISFTSIALTNGGLQLRGTGPPFTAFVFEAATNVDEAAIWTPLLTNPPGSGVFTLQFFDGTNYPQRFYRARVAP
jgi:hypothetical protein